MKEIYLRVKVPDHINPETVDIGYISHDNFNDYRAEFTEIQLPSEEEVGNERAKQVQTKYRKIENQSIFADGHQTATTWLLNKLKGE